MAFRAEIEIGVKGAQQLEAFKKQLDALGKLVDQTNKREIFGTKQVTSVNEYNSALRKATETLNNARLQLDNAGRATKTYEKAIKDYVTALGNANQRQEIQNKLIQDEIKLREEAARAARLQAAGIREVSNAYPGPIGPGPASPTALSSRLPARSRFFGGTQYSGPIGPGPASSIFGGQSSPVDVDRLVKAKKDQLELDRALFNLSKKTAEPLNLQLQLQEGLVKGTREALELAQQAKRIQGPALPPGFNFEKGAAIAASKQVEALVKKSEQASIRAAQQVNQITLDLDRKEHTAKIDQILKEFQIEERLQKSLFDNALALDKREGAAFDQELARRNAETQAFRKRRNDALGSAVIGGAFPLLFGQGLGASVGGGVGGFAGGMAGGQFGFGLSLVGTALGQAVDEFNTNISNLAASLSKPKEALEALEKAGYPVNDSIKRTVEKLLESGKAYEAQQLVLQQIKQTLGPDAIKQLSAYNIENDKLKKKFQEIKAELDKALLPALTGALKIVNDFVAGLKALANIKVPDWVKNGIKFNLQMNPVGQGILNARQGFNQLSGAGRRLAAAAPEPAAATPDPSVLERIQQDRQRQLEKAQKERAIQQEKLQNLEQELQYRTKLYAIQEKIGRAEEQGNNVLKVRLEGQARLVEEAERGRQALQGLETTQQKATQTQINNLNMFKVQADNARQIRLAQKQEDEKAKQRGEKLRADLQAKTKELMEKGKQQMAATEALAKSRRQDLNTGLTAIEQAKRLLELETQRFEISQRLQGARLSADLQVNNLEIERAKRAKNFNRVYQLELKRARLVYKQTLQQIEAEVERAKLKERQVKLAYQELRIENAKKASKGKLTREDKVAEVLAKDAVKMAAENVLVAKEIAEEQKRGALAVKQASEEAARYAYEQNKAAAATERTANAAERLNRAMSGTYSSGSGGSASGSALRRNLVAGAKSTFKELTARMNLAEGGYVTRPTKALVGERGENEYVIPESKMQSSMARYARGARGEAVVEGNGSDNGMGRRTARGTTTVNVSTGPVVRMGNKDYVTVADLNNAVGSVVATLSRDTSNKYGTNPRIS